MLESIESIGSRYHYQLVAIEWAFTLLFTAEYLLRLWCVREPGVYARSFYGVVDLLAIGPGVIALTKAHRLDDDVQIRPPLILGQVFHGEKQLDIAMAGVAVLVLRRDALDVMWRGVLPHR